MKSQSIFSLNFLLLLFLVGCQSNVQTSPSSNPQQERLQNTVKFRGETMGTYYSIIYIDPKREDLQATIEGIFDAFDFSVSTYNPKSIISHFNQNKEQQKTEIDPNFAAVFQRSKEIYALTDGYFDPTVMPLVNYWGFGVNKDKPDLDSSKVNALKALVDFPSLEVVNEEGLYQLTRSKNGVELDFSAIAKGYGVDLIGQFLADKGLTDYFVEIGGEVVTKGKNPRGEWWTVGINKPVENAVENEIEEIVQLKNQAIATSGNYLQFYEKDGQKFVHTISPKTGYTVPSNLLSITVFAQDCMTADAIATACMVMGYEKAKQFIEGQEELEALLIYSTETGEMKVYSTWLNG